MQLPASLRGTQPKGMVLVLVVAAFWLAVSLLAGTAQYLANEGVSWRAALFPPLLAGFIWWGLTLIALRLSDRYPLDRSRRAHLVIHGAAALSAPFVLNFVYVVLSAVLLGTFVTLGGVLRETRSAGLQWLHVNAGVYVAIVLLRQAYARSDSSIAEDDAVVKDPEPRIDVRTGRRLTQVPASDIRWLEGAGDYVRLHTDEGDQLADERLKHLERVLAPHGFVRVHRSAIVNFANVRELDRRTQSDWVVVLDEGTRVNVSRGRRRAVREAWQAAGETSG